MQTKQEETKPEGGKETKPDGGGNPSGGEGAMHKMQEQLDNLNKGIAKYRDDSNAAKEDARKAREELKELKDKIEEEVEEEDPKLADEDQKKLEIWARKQGFVTQKELEAEKLRMSQENLKSVENQAVSEFLQKHPEWDKDEKWTEFQKEFVQFKTPKTLPEFRQLMEKVHKNLTESDGVEEGKAQARAELQNKSRLSLGGGSQKVSGNEKDIAKLQEKYPSLSRAQIEARVAEIEALDSDKKK